MYTYHFSYKAYVEAKTVIMVWFDELSDDEYWFYTYSVETSQQINRTVSNDIYVKIVATIFAAVSILLQQQNHLIIFNKTNITNC